MLVWFVMSSYVMGRGRALDVVQRMWCKGRGAKDVVQRTWCKGGGAKDVMQGTCCKGRGATLANDLSAHNLT